MAARITFTAAQEKSICNRYTKGATLAELAEHYGCSNGTILRVLETNDVEIRPRGRRPVEA